MDDESSIECEKCGSQMKTKNDLKYTEWMRKYINDDDLLLCYDCNYEKERSSDRYIKMCIEKTDNGILFIIEMVNNTRDSIGFSLQKNMFVEESQWEDTEAWSKTKKDQKGTIGFLAVMDDNGDIIFSHEFKCIFGSSTASGQMIIGEEDRKKFSVKWNKNGEKDIGLATKRYNRYSSSPTTNPEKHDSITAVFLLEATPRGKWEYKQCSESIEI